ncbi:FCD domain-containing protein [Actinophytocola sp. NPDC049390]|uniref:FCD domain-containing protein n=1 Tax=Actinophytocola sp. NPDC049390 TaxID=3363894 RepID=UPI00378F2398
MRRCGPNAASASSRRTSRVSWARARPRRGRRSVDITFHRDVCVASGNSFLARLWRTVEPNLWGLHVVSNPLYGGDCPAMAERHAALVAAHAMSSTC